MTNMGHPVQVVKIPIRAYELYENKLTEVTKNPSYGLNEDVLREVLLKEEIKNLPVMVVNVAGGAYYNGKNVVLNFFLRYLYSPESAREDGSWLKGGETLEGFKWRGDIVSNSENTGIFLWSEPFISTLSTGEQVAVILMNSQSMSDPNGVDSQILTLSTLLSSLQIYNLPEDIQDQDLLLLEFLSTFGKMVYDESDDKKPFQVLQYLIREWEPYIYPNGAEGGEKFLQNKFKITSNKIRDIRTNIDASFENILCFLLPHPGNRVYENIFKGNINDLTEDFQKYIKELAKSTFSAENLLPKSVIGQSVNAEELFYYFKTYTKLFNINNLPEPKSIMQATVEAKLLYSFNKAREVYVKGMDANSPTKTREEILNFHNKFLAEAKADFANRTTTLTQNQVDKYLKKLNVELKYTLWKYVQSNLLKAQVGMDQVHKAYEDKIQSVSKNQPLCLHALDVDVVHNEALQAAMAVYDSGVTETPDEEKKALLIQGFNNQLVLLKAFNDKNNKHVVKDIFEEYWNDMETKLSDNQLPDAKFQFAHKTALEDALANFETKRNRPNSHAEDVYKEDLTKKINNTFSWLHTFHLRIIDLENVTKTHQEIRSLQDKITTLKEETRSKQEKMAKDQENINYLMFRQCFLLRESDIVEFPTVVENHK